MTGDDTAARSAASPAAQETPDAGTSVGPAAGSTPRRPTKAASAASRARRIGGAGRAASIGRTDGSGRSAGSTPRSPGIGTADAHAEHTRADDTRIDDTRDDDTGDDDTRADDTDAEGTHVDHGVAPASRDVALTEHDEANDGDVDLLDAPAADGDTVAGRAPSSDVVVRVPGWLTWVPALVLGAGAVAMVVLVLVAAHSVWYAKPSTSAVRDRVLAAAKTCTAQSNTYSYTSLDNDEARGAACTTGKYTQQFTQAFDRIVKPQAVKLKASQSVQINAAGIESVTRRQWTVVVYGQTKITQSGAKPRVDPFAAEVVMQQARGEWLIENIKLPSASS